MGSPERGGQNEAEKEKEKEKWRRLALVGGIIFIVALIAAL